MIFIASTLFINAQTNFLDIKVTKVDWLGLSVSDEKTTISVNLELTGYNPTNQEVVIIFPNTCKYDIYTKYIGNFSSQNADIGPCGQAFVTDTYPANETTITEESTSFDLLNYTNQTIPDGDYYFIPYTNMENQPEFSLLGIQLRRINGQDTIIRYLNYETFQIEFYPTSQTSESPTTSNQGANETSSSSTSLPFFSLIPSLFVIPIFYRKFLKIINHRLS